MSPNSQDMSAAGGITTEFVEPAVTTDSTGEVRVDYAKLLFSDTASKSIRSRGMSE